MKFSCVKENLGNFLAVLSGINIKNINLPILRNIYISAEDHGIMFIATNLEIAIKIYIRGKVEEKGEFTVPSKLFTDFVSLIEGNKIDFELKNNDLRVCGDGYETLIKGIVASDFPVIPTVENKYTFKINSNEFSNALHDVLFSASSNELRPEIGGILFRFDNKNLILAGTDSFRLAEKRLKLDTKANTAVDIIVPIKTLTELIKILNTSEDISTTQVAEITIGENQILFKKENTELISRLVEGTYPNYTQIIPTTFLTETVVNRDKLLKSVKASSLFSKSGVFDINLRFENNNIYVSSNDANLGAYNASLEAQTRGNTNKIVLNHKFLLDGLLTLTSKNIILKMIDGANPIMAENYEDKQSPDEQDKQKDYFYLVMPIRQ